MSVGRASAQLLYIARAAALQLFNTAIEGVDATSSELFKYFIHVDDTKGWGSFGAGAQLGNTGFGGSRSEPTMARIRRLSAAVCDLATARRRHGPHIPALRVLSFLEAVMLIDPVSGIRSAERYRLYLEPIGAWVSPEALAQLCAERGMPFPAMCDSARDSLSPASVAALQRSDDLRRVGEEAAELAQQRLRDRWQSEQGGKAPLLGAALLDDNELRVTELLRLAALPRVHGAGVGATTTRDSEPTNGARFSATIGSELVLAAAPAPPTSLALGADGASAHGEASSVGADLGDSPGDGFMGGGYPTGWPPSLRLSHRRTL